MKTWILTLVLLMLAVPMTSHAWVLRVHSDSDWDNFQLWATDERGRDIRQLRTGPYTGCTQLEYQMGEADRDVRWKLQKTLPKQANGDFGFLVGEPGTYEHMSPEQALCDLGVESTRAPQILDHAESDTLCFSADLTRWCGAGNEDFIYGELVSIVNGTNEGVLPGFLIGTCSLTFSSQSGWSNPCPFTGTIRIVGAVEISASQPSATGAATWGEIKTFFLSW